MVTKKIVITQRMFLLRSLLEPDGSGFDTGIIPFGSFKNDGSRQDKSYGLGRVGFPRTEPAVAAQAVSIESVLSGVANLSTRLPLSPYCNPLSAQLRQPRCFPRQNVP